MLNNINLTKTLPVRTQFLIFTLLGEYVVQRGGKIWTSSLLYLLGLLGVSERAVRSTLSRMTRKGWIRSQKHGRRSEYILTPEGRDLLEQGRQRIFEPPFTNWDGNWHLVVYSLPEGKRRVRHKLRQNLTWLGFGSLAPGTWIAPRDRRNELKYVFASLKVESFVDLFSGVYMGPTSAEDLVVHCWDLAGLEAQYEEFIARLQPEFESYQQESAETLDAVDVFVRRFWIMHDFQSFPLKDPNLPSSLLPVNWVGLTARNLFKEYHDLTGAQAKHFMDEVYRLEGNMPENGVPGESRF